MSRVILVALGALLAVSLGVVNYGASAELRAVQSGELTLRCVMADGKRTIKANQVEGLMDGVWLFTGDGYARNCEVVKGGDL